MSDFNFKLIVWNLMSDSSYLVALCHIFIAYVASLSMAMLTSLLGQNALTGNVWK